LLGSLTPFLPGFFTGFLTNGWGFLAGFFFTGFLAGGFLAGFLGGMQIALLD
jgi:hypothetical protein